MNPVPIEITGDCTLPNLGKLHRQLTSRLTAAEAVNIDLSAMASIDAAGVQLLLAMKKNAAAAGKTFTLLAPPDFLEQTLQNLGLDPDLLTG